MVLRIIPTTDGLAIAAAHLHISTGCLNDVIRGRRPIGQQMPERLAR